MLNVGTHVTGESCYIRNLSNRHIYTINTDLDGLYPASETRKLIKMCQDQGIGIFYKEYWDIGHDFQYAEKEIPIMINDMMRNVRDPFRSEIYWEAHDMAYGKCDWIEITSIDTTIAKAGWHREYNTVTANNRIQIGFYHDPEYDGIGVKVNGLVDGTPAAEMGLRTDDTIVSMDDKDIQDIDDLSACKDLKKRGDSFTLTVDRERELITLEGLFPETQYYDAMLYEHKSGAVKAVHFGNIFDIRTSRVKSLKIYLNPEMINMDIPVRIIVNGTEMVNRIFDYDPQLMIENFEETLDRKAVWVNAVVIAL
jgi:hypothetical protein